MSRRPATATGRRREESKQQKTSTTRPQTAGRWGYDVGSADKQTTRNRFGKGVSAPPSKKNSRRRQRRPASSSSSPSTSVAGGLLLTTRPQFDTKHMFTHSRRRRQIDPTYTIKYLGIPLSPLDIPKYLKVRLVFCQDK